MKFENCFFLVFWLVFSPMHGLYRMCPRNTCTVTLFITGMSFLVCAFLQSDNFSLNMGLNTRKPWCGITLRLWNMEILWCVLCLVQEKQSHLCQIMYTYSPNYTFPPFHLFLLTFSSFSPFSHFPPIILFFVPPILSRFFCFLFPPFSPF